MRQRTKIGTRYEMRNKHGDVLATCIDPGCVGVSRDGVERIVKVTRYRLAPLVEMPAWAIDKYGDWRTANGDVSANIEVDGDEDPAYEIDVCGPDYHEYTVLEGSSLASAKAWAESKLRDLGYRVAKAKGGAA